MLLALLFSGVTIKLLPEAHVRGTEIELATIASIEGDDPAEVARIKSLKLGYAPAPGYSRLIFGSRLSSDVTRLIPGIAVTLKGADTCRVLPATERVQGAKIEAAARAEVLRWFEGRDIELELISLVPDVELPSGDKPTELRAVYSDANQKAGPINVPVRLLVNGGIYRTVWTNWRLSVWELASVPKRAIANGETITLDMLESRRVLSPGSGPEAALAAGLAVGATAKRELQAGVPLREMDVSRPVLVKRGDALLVEVRRGNVHARTAATAEADARSGERIRVTVIDSKRALTATVVSRDLAIIELGRDQ